MWAVNRGSGMACGIVDSQRRDVELRHWDQRHIAHVVHPDHGRSHRCGGNLHGQPGHRRVYQLIRPA